MTKKIKKIINKLMSSNTKNDEKNDENVIVKIYEVSKSGQLLVNIPKKSGFKKGDYILITKIEV